MHRLRTVTYLDDSAVAGHHAMPAALLFPDLLQHSLNHTQNTAAAITWLFFEAATLFWRRMNDLPLYVIFQQYFCISGGCYGYNERLCAMEPRLRLERFPP